MVEIIIRIKGINKSPKEVIKRQRKDFNLELFKEKANIIDWTKLLETEDVNVSYDMFENLIRNILDKLAPMKKVKIKSNHKSWLTPATRDLITLRDKKREEARIHWYGL